MASVDDERHPEMFRQQVDRRALAARHLPWQGNAYRSLAHAFRFERPPGEPSELTEVDVRRVQQHVIRWECSRPTTPGSDRRASDLAWVRGWHRRSPRSRG